MARYEVVPNIVEVKEPAPNTKERSKKTILYVGAFRKVKNLPLLVEAVRLLAEKGATSGSSSSVTARKGKGL